jgi:hypothetical protein
MIELIESFESYWIAWVIGFKNSTSWRLCPCCCEFRHADVSAMFFRGGRHCWRARHRCAQWTTIRMSKRITVRDRRSVIIHAAGITVTYIFYCNCTVLESSNTDGTTVRTVLLYGTTSSTLSMVIILWVLLLYCSMVIEYCNWVLYCTRSTVLYIKRVQ